MSEIHKLILSNAMYQLQRCRLKKSVLTFVQKNGQRIDVFLVLGNMYQIRNMNDMILTYYNDKIFINKNIKLIYLKH